MIIIEELTEVRVGDSIEVLKRKFDMYTHRTYYFGGKLYKVKYIWNKHHMIHLETESKQGKHIVSFNTNLPTYYYDDYVIHTKRKDRITKINSIV